MAVPSVKGAMLLPSVVMVRHARDQGKIPQAELSRLGAETLGLLDKKINLAQWYPMGHFTELLDLDWTLFGDRAPEYMRRSGEQSATAMARHERYQQLEYIKRVDRPKSTAQLISQVRLTSSITLSYYNFMEVMVRVHPERQNVLQIIYSNTDPFPEALRYSTEGFMNELNRVRGSERKWSSERVVNTIVFSLEMKQR